MSEKFEISALAAANFFIHKALSEQSSLTAGRLSRLLYHAQARAITGRAERLFSDELVVGAHGPVIYEVGRALTRWGGAEIRSPIESYDLRGGVREWEVWIPTLPLDFWGRQTLASTWAEEGALSDVELMRLTHRRSGAYCRARELNASEISTDLIVACS